MTRRNLTLAGFAGAGALAALHPLAGHAAGCAQLSHLELAHTGTIRPTPDSDIRFEVWMPASNGNGKFVGVGNGVWAGSIAYSSMRDPLSMGYATAATDDGHQSNPLDAGFAAGANGTRLFLKSFRCAVR